MRSLLWGAAVPMCLLLASCGGGGGIASAGSTGSGGTGGSTPTPSPTPVNTTLTDLRASQTFATIDAGASVAFDLTTKTTIAGSKQDGALTVSYDAAAQSYTVSKSGRSQTFGQADVAASSTAETQYQKSAGSTRDYLTLVKIPYSGSTPTRYVGLGYWQQNALSGTRQDTLFDVFTYGFPTAAGAAPRTGSASFGVDVFGLASTPGYEPNSFIGHGTFDVDFAAGVFSTNTYVTETGLLSGSSIVGGGVQLQGAGHLSSTDATFSGNMLYGGRNGNVAGNLSGQFYGPAGEELGASFSGSNSDGATVTGGFTGQRSGNPAASNLTLTNLTMGQLFYTQEADLTYTSFDGNVASPTARTTSMISQFNRQNSDTFSYGPGSSNLPGGTFTATSLTTASDPNFIAYQKTFNGQDVRLELYKPGGANTELALTYASFGRWSGSSNQGVVTQADRVYFAYGLETPARLLSAKTGSGHYAGVAYGAAANEKTGAQYDVKGSSTFDVNFSNQSYTGALALKGTSTNGAAAADFGAFTFGGNLAAYTAQTDATVMQGGTNVGSLSSRFFGPDGEEIGGPFTLNVADSSGVGRTSIVGVAVAKRQ